MWLLMKQTPYNDVTLSKSIMKGVCCERYTVYTRICATTSQLLAWQQKLITLYTLKFIIIMLIKQIRWIYFDLKVSKLFLFLILHKV